MTKVFPVIDPVATGQNIIRLRKARGLTVRDLQDWFGFEEPQAIYKWQRGKSLPTIDNLYALGALLDVSMEEILVPYGTRTINKGQQVETCCPSVCQNAFWQTGRGQRSPKVKQTEGVGVHRYGSPSVCAESQKRPPFVLPGGVRWMDL